MEKNAFSLRIFLIVTFLIIGVSILAVYTTTLATELGLEKDDLQITSLAHLMKSMDWENDYNEEKLVKEF